MTKHFTIVSPEMSEIIPILDDGSGPREYFRNVVTIEAATKRDALALSLRCPEMSEWVMDARSDGVNPFSGLSVNENICPHGKCVCEHCWPDYDDNPPCLLCHKTEAILGEAA